MLQSSSSNVLFNAFGFWNKEYPTPSCRNTLLESKASKVTRSVVTVSWFTHSYCAWTTMYTTCRFQTQSYAKSRAIAYEIYNRNWQSVNHIPGIHDNGPPRVVTSDFNSVLPTAKAMVGLLACQRAMPNGMAMQWLPTFSEKLLFNSFSLFFLLIINYPTIRRLAQSWLWYWYWYLVERGGILWIFSFLPTFPMSMILAVRTSTKLVFLPITWMAYAIARTWGFSCQRLFGWR